MINIRWLLFQLFTLIYSTSTSTPSSLSDDIILAGIICLSAIALDRPDCGELGALELRPVRQDCKLPLSIVEGDIDDVVRSVAPAACTSSACCAIDGNPAARAVWRRTFDIQFDTRPLIKMKIIQIFEQVFMARNR